MKNDPGKMYFVGNFSFLISNCKALIYSHRLKASVPLVLNWSILTLPAAL